MVKLRQSSCRARPVRFDHDVADCSAVAEISMPLLRTRSSRAGLEIIHEAENRAIHIEKSLGWDDALPGPYDKQK